MTRDSTANPNRSFTPIALAVLILASAIAPLATTTYLPGLPDVAADLSATSSEIQLTLTAFIVGIAAGQLVVGPLSDKVGRRIPLFAGIAIFAVVSFASAYVESLEWLITLRTLQGFAAASGIVLGRAIVADRTSGDETARLLSLMMAIGVLVPALAPLLGAGVLLFGTWRTVFVVLAAVAAVMAVLVLLVVPETRPRRRPDAIDDEGRATAAERRAGRPRTRRGAAPFIFYTLAISFSFATMYAYIASGPYVFQSIHGFSPLGYAATTGGISLLMGLVGYTMQRRIGSPSPFGQLTPERLATAGVSVMLVGALLVGLVSLLQPPAWAWIVAFAILAAPMAIFTGLTTALAMAASPWQAGLSSALIGTVQSAIGAAAPPIAGLSGETSTTSMSILMLSAAVLTVITFALARRASRQHPA